MCRPQPQRKLTIFVAKTKNLFFIFCFIGSTARPCYSGTIPSRAKTANTFTRPPTFSPDLSLPIATATFPSPSGSWPRRTAPTSLKSSNAPEIVSTRKNNFWDKAIFGLFLYNSQEIVFIDLPLLFLHLMHVIFDDSPLLILFNRYFTHHRNCYSCWLMLLIPIFAFIQNYLFNFFFFKLVV